MLRFKIIPTILMRGYMYPYKYLVKTIGMGSGKATKYTQNVQQSISLQDLSALCRHLQCSPNDLLYWDNTVGQPLAHSHPCMQALSPAPAIDTWYKAIQKLSPQQAQEILHLMHEKSSDTKG